MKTRIATLLLVSGLFISLTAFSKEPVPASKAVAQSVAKEIQKELEYPEFAIRDKFECCVLVSLVIREDGTFDVDCANCVSADMKEDVIRQIENMDAEKFAMYAGQTVLLKIKFDLLLI